jgi:hypothetical protein
MVQIHSPRPTFPLSNLYFTQHFPEHDPSSALFGCGLGFLAPRRQRETGRFVREERYRRVHRGGKAVVQTRNAANSLP